MEPARGEPRFGFAGIGAFAEQLHRAFGNKRRFENAVFAQSRTMVEVLAKYLKDVFDNDPRKPARIRAYRGGYLPTERREAEKAMRDGHIDGIVSTSALELAHRVRF